MTHRKFLTGAAAVIAVATVKPPIPVGAYVRQQPAWVPKGWLLADGRAVLKTDYPALLEAIGIAYGGSETTFNLPDLATAAPIGTLIAADGNPDNMPVGMVVTHIKPEDA